MVASSALFLVTLLLFPFFRKTFQILLLASWSDTYVVLLATLVWALVLRTFWRLTARYSL